MEHTEEAGVHSGDSSCAIPPPTLAADVVHTIETYTEALAEELGVVGLLNVQYAVKDKRVFVIEANPRASRTVPFVSKATGVPLAKIAARIMVGATFAELAAEGLLRPPAPGRHVAVKEAVLPFNRFPDVDTILGPEMRSTGEVMGIDRTFGMAFAKSQAGAGNKLPHKGTVFLSLADRDKDAGLVRGPALLRPRLLDRGHRRNGAVAREQPGAGRHDRGEGGRGGRGRRGRADLVGQGRPRDQHAPGRGPRADGMHIRRAAIVHGVACITTVAAAVAAAAGITEEAEREPDVRSLQEYHADGQLRLEV